VKIYVYPADMGGCGYYRMIWPALAAKAQGHDVTVVLPKDRDYGDNAIHAEMRGEEVIRMGIPRDADVMVFQRVTHKFLCQGMRLIREMGVAVVVDMDDDLGKVHPSNPAYPWMHPRSSSEHSWHNAARACKDATIVTVSTPALLRPYAPRGNGRVLYNMVQKKMLDIPRADEGRFGWTGSLHSHPNDPSVTGPAVQRLVNDGYGFSMVGNPEGVAAEFRITLEQFHTTGIVDTLKWGEALATLHVGIAPLADTAFNSAKSWLKPLELGAVGVPCVTSPRAEYRRINKLGVGVLAATPKDWYREVKRLMDDTTWYQEVAERSKSVVSGLTVEENAWRWVEVWAEAYQIAQQAGSVLRSNA
jgi:hypothetical protein